MLKNDYYEAQPRKLPKLHQPQNLGPRSRTLAESGKMRVFGCCFLKLAGRLNRSRGTTWDNYSNNYSLGWSGVCWDDWDAVRRQISSTNWEWNQSTEHQGLCGTFTTELSLFSALPSWSNGFVATNAELQMPGFWRRMPVRVHLWVHCLMRVLRCRSTTKVIFTFFGLPFDLEILFLCPYGNCNCPKNQKSKSRKDKTWRIVWASWCTRSGVDSRLGKWWFGSVIASQ